LNSSKVMPRSREASSAFCWSATEKAVEKAFRVLPSSGHFFQLFFLVHHFPNQEAQHLLAWCNGIWLLSRVALFLSRTIGFSLPIKPQAVIRLEDSLVYLASHLAIFIVRFSVRKKFTPIAKLSSEQTKTGKEEDHVGYFYPDKHIRKTAGLHITTRVCKWNNVAEVGFLEQFSKSG
jgi:hypothetical protein